VCVDQCWTGYEVFLSSRRQQVVVEGMFSSWVEVLSGVLRGSVLGPVLFVCYVYDMPDMITSFIYMYADDAKIMNCVSDEFDQTCLQSDLDTMTKCSREWQLTFNVNKCKVVHFGIRNRNCPYTMEGHSGTHLNRQRKRETWGSGWIVA